MRVIIGGLLFLVISASAFGQDNNACRQAVQPQVDDFGRCAIYNVSAPVAGRIQAQAATAEAAIGSCPYFARGLYMSFKEFPCYQNHEEAESSVEGVLDQMRKDLNARLPAG